MSDFSKIDAYLEKNMDKSIGLYFHGKGDEYIVTPGRSYDGVVNKAELNN